MPDRRQAQALLRQQSAYRRLTAGVSEQAENDYADQVIAIATGRRRAQDVMNEDIRYPPPVPLGVTSAAMNSRSGIIRELSPHTFVLSPPNVEDAQQARLTGEVFLLLLRDILCLNLPLQVPITSPHYVDPSTVIPHYVTASTLTANALVSGSRSSRQRRRRERASATTAQDDVLQLGATSPSMQESSSRILAPPAPAIVGSASTSDIRISSRQRSAALLVPESSSSAAALTNASSSSSMVAPRISPRSDLVHLHPAAQFCDYFSRMSATCRLNSLPSQGFRTGSHWSSRNGTCS